MGWVFLISEVPLSPLSGSPELQTHYRLQVQAKEDQIEQTEKDLAAVERPADEVPVATAVTPAASPLTGVAGQSRTPFSRNFRAFVPSLRC